MKKVFKIVAYFSIIFFIALLTLGLIAYTLSLGEKLDENKLKKSKGSAILCYASGEIMDCDQNQEYTPIDEISKDVINAVVSIEDKRFYKHSGIDVKSILRALKNNVFSGKAKEGASTITQQLIKNTHLSGEKTVKRKLKEMRLAIELEKKFDKNQILEMYLNTVYFGEGAYGISSASKIFFNKKANELTLAESATLIACLKAPTYYSPYKNLTASTKRRNLVLKEMHDQGYIDAKSYNIAKNTEIILNFSNDYETNNKLYDEILSSAIKILNANSPSDLNGFKIYTSIDKGVQNIIPNVADYGIDCDFSVLITENKSSKIVGYYSTVGTLKRCPASTAKPWLIYAPAIEEDLICPATKILDERINFDGYSPSNYNDKYYGYVSVKECLAKSLNVPSVKICNSLGLEKVSNYAKRLGIEYTNSDLSVALGNLSGGVTLKELSDAYSVFSNDGYYKESCFINKITNSKGKTIYSRTVLPKKVYSDSTIYLINDMLKECAISGTASKLKGLGFDVCAKTGTNGTSQGNIDAYCVAYTTNHTISVWLGKANGEHLSNLITGGSYPTQIVKDVFKNLYKYNKPSGFTPPQSVKLLDIDKSSYENDCKIYKNQSSEKDGVKFWFKSNYNLEIMPNSQELPFVKSYKIACNKRNIEIICETEIGVYYKIFLNDKLEVFDSKNGGVFQYCATTDGEYLFTVLPYKIIDGKEIFGEKIKLPSVLVEGKKEILDLDWWEE